ncbi:MAG: hypothetical protein NTW86_19500, partial [Candidatus Sumerlaeota bacterium]|nr:hypothetical protein [Candidatus Sumerlaeota bacterium]
GQPNVVTATKTLQFCKIAIAGNDLAFQAVDQNGVQIDSFNVTHASKVHDWRGYARLSEKQKPLHDDARLTAVGASELN